jgi:hypothetical protein
MSQFDKFSNWPYPWVLVFDRFLVQTKKYSAFRSQDIHTPSGNQTWLTHDFKTAFLQFGDFPAST